jgi:hypothetical protein
MNESEEELGGCAGQGASGLSCPLSSLEEGYPTGAQNASSIPLPSFQVAEILGAILVHLPVVDHLEVRHLLIEGILLLAHYHQETVLTSLLRQPLPRERLVPWRRWTRLGSLGPGSTLSYLEAGQSSFILCRRYLASVYYWS